MSLIDFPILYINDPVKGRPLFSGQIFVGEPDLDPEVVVNQKQLRIVQEDGTRVDVDQPFILSAGGVPIHNGSTVRLDVDGNYSLKILDKLGDQAYLIENVFEGEPVTQDDLDNRIDRLNPATLAIAIADATLQVDDVLHVQEEGGSVWHVLTKGTTAAVDLPNGFDLRASTGNTLLVLVLQPVSDELDAVAAGFVTAAGDQKLLFEALAERHNILVPDTPGIAVLTLPNIQSKTVRLQRFDQVDLAALEDLNAMTTDKGFQGGVLAAEKFRKFGIGVLACTIRKEAVGTDVWNFINDASHQTIGFDPDQTLNAGALDLTLLYDRTYSKVGALLAGPDETIGGSFSASPGLSVSRSTCTLRIGKTVSFSDLVNWNTGTLEFDKSTLHGDSSATYIVVSTNRVQVNHELIEKPIVSVKRWSKNATIAPYEPLLSTTISYGAAFILDFMDSAGNLAPVFTTGQHAFNLEITGTTNGRMNGTGDAQQTGNQWDEFLVIGNIWIAGWHLI